MVELSNDVKEQIKQTSLSEAEKNEMCMAVRATLNRYEERPGRRKRLETEVVLVWISVEGEGALEIAPVKEALFALGVGGASEELLTALAEHRSTPHLRFVFFGESSHCCLFVPLPTTTHHAEPSAGALNASNHL